MSDSPGISIRFPARLHDYLVRSVLHGFVHADVRNVRFSLFADAGPV